MPAREPARVRCPRSTATVPPVRPTNPGVGGIEAPRGVVSTGAPSAVDPSPTVPVPLTRVSPPAPRPPPLIIGRRGGGPHAVTIRGLHGGKAPVSASLVSVHASIGAAAVAVPTTDGETIFMVPSTSVSRSAQKGMRRASIGTRRSAKTAAPSRAFTSSDFQRVEYRGQPARPEYRGQPARPGHLITGGGLRGWVVNAGMKEVLITSVRGRQREGNKMHVYSVCDAPLPGKVGPLVRVEKVSLSGEKMRTHTDTAKKVLFDNNADRAFGNVIRTANGRQELFQRLSEREELSKGRTGRAWLAVGASSAASEAGAEDSPAFMLCNCQQGRRRDWDCKSSAVSKCQYGLQGVGAEWTAPSGVWPGKKRCADNTRRPSSKKKSGKKPKKTQ